MTLAIKRRYSSTIVPKPEALENSEFPVDKFACLHHLHHGPEGYELISESVETLLPQEACVFLQVGMIIFEGIGEVLHGVGRPFGVVLVQQPADAVIMKKAGGHDLGDMFFFHPFQPAFMDRRRYFYGYIIDEHSYDFSWR